MSVIGPALIDLTYIYDVPTKTIAIVTSLTAVGYCIGALSAVMFRWINRQLTLCISLIIGCIAFGLLPQGSSIAVLFSFAPFLGFSQGVLDASQNVWLLELWHENPNPIMQLAQAMFGAGTIVAPLVAGPYLTGDVDTNSTNTTTITVTSEERREKLTIPFAILSASMMLGVAVMILMFFIRRYEPPPKEILEKSRDANTEETKLFERVAMWKKVLVIGLASLSLGSYVSVEVSFFNFSATFAQKIPLKVSAPDAATIQSVFAVAFTAARALNFFIAMKLKPSQLLIIHYSIVVLSQIGLLFAGRSLIVLWIANVAIGYGFSAMWSSILTFTERYLILNDTVGGVMLAFAGVFGAIIPYLVGLLIESLPMALVYVGLGITGFSIALHVVIRLMVRSQKAAFSYAGVPLVFHVKNVKK